MNVLGSITFDWDGTQQTVVATTPMAIGVTPPAIIDLRDEWVCVSVLGIGTMLVAWEWVRSFSGWAPVPAEDR